PRNCRDTAAAWPTPGPHLTLKVYASGSEITLVLIEVGVLSFGPSRVAEDRHRQERLRRASRRSVGEPLRGARIEIASLEHDRLAGDAGPRIERLLLDGVAEHHDFQLLANPIAVLPEEALPGCSAKEIQQRGVPANHHGPALVEDGQQVAQRTAPALRLVRQRAG